MKQRLLYMPARKGERGGGAPELEAHRFLYSSGYRPAVGKLPAERRSGMDSMEVEMSLFKRHSLSCIIGIINKVKAVQIGVFSHPVSSSESKMSVGIVKYRKEFLFIF